MDDCDMSEEKTEKAFRNNIKSTLSMQASYQRTFYLGRILNSFLDTTRFAEIWTVEQDERLKELVSQHGMGWTKIGEVFGERNGKQCRERWYNHLDPAVNKGEWTLEVSFIIVRPSYYVSDYLSASMN